MPRPPRNFNDFVGQSLVIQRLKRLIAGAQVLGRPCPSLLVKAPAGHGKTALGRAVAREYGTECHSYIAGTDTRPGDVCDLLLNVRHADVVLLDEAHSLRGDAQQILFNALDDAKIPAVTEKGRLDRSRMRSVALCTFILATNQPGQLKPALQSRLTPIELVPYSLRELKAIAERVAELEGTDITPQAARRLAEVAQGSPRIISRRVEALRLFSPGVAKYGIDHVEELLASEGVDNFGIWPSQRVYMQSLAASPGGACSLERLAVKLGCDIPNVRRAVEPFLIEQGWVEPHSGRGRMITAEGRAVVPAVNTDDDPEES